MKKGPLVARVLKLSLHLHLVFTSGITFNYLIKVTLQHSWSKGFSLYVECCKSLTTHNKDNTTYRYDLKLLKVTVYECLKHKHTKTDNME